ncbi:unnamed protein product [Rangifer tarandus platyrhynchus]|uniref:Uncharacterized protein n=1 Tax=Rangifer tarandus platyrhynchus TaxID=3082113 RepID=A0ABN8XIP2_RANTA|nr:unnamed protein product [Rangifer tarandus platyrhynchus]
MLLGCSLWNFRSRAVFADKPSHTTMLSGTFLWCTSVSVALRLIDYSNTRHDCSRRTSVWWHAPNKGQLCEAPAHAWADEHVQQQQQQVCSMHRKCVIYSAYNRTSRRLRLSGSCSFLYMTACRNDQRGQDRTVYEFAKSECIEKTEQCYFAYAYPYHQRAIELFVRYLVQRSAEERLLLMCVSASRAYLCAADPAREVYVRPSCLQSGPRPVAVRRSAGLRNLRPARDSLNGTRRRCTSYTVRQVRRKAWIDTSVCDIDAWSLTSAARDVHTPRREHRSTENLHGHLILRQYSIHPGMNGAVTLYSCESIDSRENAMVTSYSGMTASTEEQMPLSRRTP